jgi:T-complex protein 1 subunit epsilon
MALAFDEFGRPFVIIKEQDQKVRLRGLDAQKANIASGMAVSRILRNSLGPKGMDKMLQSPDGDVTISQYSSLSLMYFATDIGFLKFKSSLIRVLGFVIYYLWIWISEMF